MTTHAEHAAMAKVATPCTAHSLTFGGRCLNCGYEPKQPDTREAFWLYWGDEPIGSVLATPPASANTIRGIAVAQYSRVPMPPAGVLPAEHLARLRRAEVVTFTPDGRRLVVA